MLTENQKLIWPPKPEMLISSNWRIRSKAQRQISVFGYREIEEAVYGLLRQRPTTGNNKTAELSQRRPSDARNIWVPQKVLRVLTTHPGTCPEICNGLLFRSILRMCVQNLKFVALPVPEITGGTQKSWAVPGYAHAPFSSKILKGFCSGGPFEYTCQVWRS